MPNRLVIVGPRDRLPLGEVEAPRDLLPATEAVPSVLEGGHESILTRLIKSSLTFRTAASNAAALSFIIPAF